RPGDLLRESGLEDGERLAELHRAPLQLAEHPEELVGGPLLELGRHHVGRAATEPLAQPEGGPSGDAQRQRRELRRPGHRLPRKITHASSSSRVVRRGLPAATGSAGSSAPLSSPPHICPDGGTAVTPRPPEARPSAASQWQPHSGWALIGRRRTSPSVIDTSSTAPRLGGEPPSRWMRACSAPRAAVVAASAPSQAGGGAGRSEPPEEPEQSCASSRGQAGSRSARRMETHRPQGVSPGSTNGPTTHVVSSTPA